jgi:acetylornithine aminotransferase/acetylornithine/N-succinyldiaminopimelate aminotransferase
MSATQTATQAISKLGAVQQQEQALLIPTYERFPVLFERGEGAYLYDADGKKYLDLLSGIGVNALGYSHPVIEQALIAQAKRLTHISNLFFHEHQAKLAALLTELSGLDRAFFCNSGTEAWEAAMKLARAYARHVTSKPGGRKGTKDTKKNAKPKAKFLVMENSFHGRTFGSLSTTGTKKYRVPFGPLVPGVTFAKFNDVADLKKKFDANVCAIGLEAVQGEGGVQPVSKQFIETARSLSKKTGALLIVDEIQSGLGRTGKYFAYQHYGVQPDIVTVAKPIAAGLPLGAVLTTNKVAEAFHPGMHGTTFGGGPLACAVAVAFVNELTHDGMLKNITLVGNYFQGELNKLKAKHTCIKQVRGIGLMLAAELDNADLAKTVVKQMLAQGFIINRTHDTVLRFLPPYIVTTSQIDSAVAALDSILTQSTSEKA